ncbi:Uncharacterised protein [Salmonella enterica subsp. indica]|uniref:Uncharacterized protein n=1 Tax=Salmonella enterica subsp. indica TaxID=59207 RepID=A0A379XQF3_SALER|nr:Uncharacterised protein [Salmonella enterica subsp. indica]
MLFFHASRSRLTCFKLALKKPLAARITDWAGAESVSGRMLLLVLLKVLYSVINQEVNYGISNFNDYCSKHYRTET